MERKPHAAPTALRAPGRNDALRLLAASRPVPAPWALRAIGRRGALMRHAALQTQAMAAGAALDVRRLPSSPPAASSLPPAIERHVEELGRTAIVVEN